MDIQNSVLFLFLKCLDKTKSILQEAYYGKNNSKNADDIDDKPETTASADAEDPNDISEALISLLEEDNANSPAEENVLANMAAALETPDSVMADFYDGIEDIFLNG